MIMALEYKIPQLQVFYDHGDTGLCITKKHVDQYKTWPECVQKYVLTSTLITKIFSKILPSLSQHLVNVCKHVMPKQPEKIN